MLVFIFYILLYSPKMSLWIKVNPFESSFEKAEKQWTENRLLSSTMFIYSGKCQESQLFHGYVQRDINSSHLLHKAHSAGTVPGTREHGDKEDTHCTLSSSTAVLPLQEKDKGMAEETEEGGGGLDSYSNTKEHVQIV